MVLDEFESLFEEEPSGGPKKKEPDDLFTFDEHGHDKHEEERPRPAEPAPRPVVDDRPPVRRAQPVKKRTSEDFQPDMDALVITAQSPLIIEGMKCLQMKDFTANTLHIYSEAMKGAEVFIKILERNPNNYYKLSPIIKSDSDCKEIETVAFGLYRTKHREMPESDTHILKAYEMLRNRLKIGYNKALVSTSMLSIKKYFHLSGTLDQEKISSMVLNNNKELKNDVIKFIQHLNIAIQLMKIGDYEITKGLKGRDINTFVIRTSQLLAYYYLAVGDTDAQDYYRRMHDNYKKYFVIRD
ncbi:MAG TPA: hypothetical protein PLA65_13090 [Spirochaetota bacterium]|nr:hypothetical protein [Spirochaetota bacterium]HOD15323.1 hypothetical protein [Spirochaetota bacterium]HPG50025.1 hypothetical protein [Spirochaetota bacterium]HPN12991.1 hypothetical protein [Spirochaetota bacterium]